MLKDATAGHPVTGLKWTRKTSRKLSRALRRKGFKVGPDTVRRLLSKLGYTRRVNRKRLSNRQDADRDRQMRYVARRRKALIAAGCPVISVDTKKRELIGNFKNAGASWRKRPLEVFESDYPSDADGVAIPYGIYDVARNEGFVVIGTSHQTPEFAVAALRSWWIKRGQKTYSGKRELLIEADCGGVR